MSMSAAPDSQKTRVETDSIGAIEVAAERYWGRKHSVLYKISISVRKKCPRR